MSSKRGMNPYPRQNSPHAPVKIIMPMSVRSSSPSVRVKSPSVRSSSPTLHARGCFSPKGGLAFTSFVVTPPSLSASMASTTPGLSTTYATPATKTPSVPTKSACTTPMTKTPPVAIASPIRFEQAAIQRGGDPASEIQLVSRRPSKEDEARGDLSARSEKQAGSATCNRRDDAARPFPKRKSVTIAFDNRVTDIPLPRKSDEARAADPFMTSFMAAWDFALDNTLAREAPRPKKTRMDSVKTSKTEADSPAAPAASSKQTSFMDAWDFSSLDARMSMYQSTRGADKVAQQMTTSRRETSRITDVPIPRPPPWLCQQLFNQKPLGAQFFAENAIGA
mmetsp:Transcript_110109/g.194638  ORF Transcript_110109/g.194638 Transcript_110109/m.194638 type:complete len:336 (+) Transcript_110109:65-1072(+)